MGLTRLTMKLEDVPEGHVATIVTHLEMLEKPELPCAESALDIANWSNPPVDEYRSLFRQVGEPWMWISRLLMENDELKTILDDPAVAISIVRDDVKPVGFVELDFRVSGQCEIAFFGLIPEYNGAGHGRWMMNQALDQAWRDGVNRVWLHSCTQDSPRALPFYRDCGFRIFRQQAGIMTDPRLTGHLPRSAAPHVPILS